MTRPNTNERPATSHRYLRMRVRADVFRHVLRWGLPWEEITVRFQAWFYREHNVYNLDFWNHFQDKLLSQKPAWGDHDEFAREMSPASIGDKP